MVIAWIDGHKIEIEGVRSAVSCGEFYDLTMDSPAGTVHRRISKSDHLGCFDSLSSPELTTKVGSFIRNMHAVGRSVDSSALRKVGAR